MANTAVFSVAYKASLPFIGSFLSSLENQLDKDFDLLLVLDGVSETDIGLSRYRDLFSVYTIDCTGSVASIREQAVRWLMTLNYNEIIFSDADDRLAADRVRVCRAQLSNSPVVVNDVIPFYNEGELSSEGFWKNRLQDGYVFDYQFITGSNIVGLGNTSVRKSVLEKLSIPSSLVAVDWFLFYHLLRKNNAVFLHHGCVEYRQHRDNTAGIRVIDAPSLIRVASVKEAHFKALSENFPDMTKKFIAQAKLREKLVRDTYFINEKVEYLNMKHINYFWWEETEYLIDE